MFKTPLGYSKVSAVQIERFLETSRSNQLSLWLQSLRPRTTTFQEQQSSSFDSYYNKKSSKNSSQKEKYRSSLESFRPSTHHTEEDSRNSSWFYKNISFPSPELASSNIEADRRRRINYRCHDRTDFLSLSLSPPGSQHQSSTRDFPSLHDSPSRQKPILKIAVWIICKIHIFEMTDKKILVCYPNETSTLIRFQII
nr:unnamed protein product [Callosobruchus analis]